MYENTSTLDRIFLPFAQIQGMALLKNTYLARVYRYDKKLFGFILAFGGLTVLFNLAGDEITPFFVWGMYSEKIRPPEEYEFLKTTVNDTAFIDTYSGFSDNTRFYLNLPLQYYELIRANKGADPAISFLQQKLGLRYAWVRPLENRLFNPWPLPQFPAWNGRYLAQTINAPVTAIKIEDIRVHYDTGQHLVTDSTYLLEEWKLR
jgi:hypothetical protein